MPDIEDLNVEVSINGMDPEEFKKLLEDISSRLEAVNRHLIQIEKNTKGGNVSGILDLDPYEPNITPVGEEPSGSDKRTDWSHPLKYDDLTTVNVENSSGSIVGKALVIFDKDGGSMGNVVSLRKEGGDEE